MKRATKLELSERADRLSKENGLLCSAVQILGRKDIPQAKVSFTEGGSRYRFDLYHVMGALGGIVIVTFHCKGQRDSIDVISLDDLADRYRGQPYDEASMAVGKLLNARRAILDIAIKAANPECFPTGLQEGSQS